jgi:elongator complex protein 1
LWGPSHSSETFFEGENSGIDAPDDISVVATDISTSASLFTRYTAQSHDTRATRSSSRNRRREERKRARGKKGTVYEEEYLVNSIGRLIARMEDTRDDVGRLVRVLMIVDKRFEAGEVQKGFGGLVEEIRGCVEEVFSEGVVGEGRLESNRGDGLVPSLPVVLPYRGVDILP